MFYAINEQGNKIEATPNAKATCECCGAPVKAKCGSIKVWHWAHLNKQDCDSFSEPMTQWHKDWQSLFPQEYREVLMTDLEGTKHRADVCVTQKNGSKIILEFQHSSISTKEIEQRERFYNSVGKLVWIFDARSWKTKERPSLNYVKSLTLLDNNADSSDVSICSPKILENRLLTSYLNGESIRFGGRTLKMSVVEAAESLANPASAVYTEEVNWRVELEELEKKAIARRAELEEREKLWALKREKDRVIEEKVLARRAEQIQAHLEPFFTQLTLLSSDHAIDYTRLRDLLTAGKWKDADYETYLVMLKAVDREKGDFIRYEELLNFPCTDLSTIDSLWVQYSSGRFGFSVQKKIYLEVGGIPDSKYDEEAWKKFGDRVGWRVKNSVKESWISYDEVIYDTTSPVGHLPSLWAVRTPPVSDFLLYAFLLSHRDF